MPILTGPQLLRSRGELARARAVARAGGGTLALVPTMGALHDGHRALLRAARTLADTVCVSIFVNPLQFGPGEDLDRYPRTFDADLALCREEGVGLVFAPTADVIYPTRPTVTVSAGPLGDLLEGASRPGHFDGVLTVVAKLFALVGPDVALFGEKDAQQLVLVRRMVADLDMPVHVVGVPTVRTADGLARSSRNSYLDPTAARAALALPRALAAGAAAAAGGPAAVLAAAAEVLAAEPAVATDYLVLVDPEELTPVPAGGQGPALLAVAARVGGVRLIDNAALVLGGAG